MLNAIRFLILGFTLCLSHLAVAQTTPAPGFEKNVQLLRSSDDFRVRTQAALALGASNEERAVQPLCGALADTHRTVRIASATAISRLRKGGGECLRRRVAVEPDAAVLSAMQRALDRLTGAGAEPAIGPGTRIFVAIDRLAGPGRLNDPVRAAFVKGAAGRSEVAFAPAGLTLEQAAELLKKYPGTKAFLLSPKLSRPVYEGGMLQVKISVAILSYPGNALMGSFSKTAGMSGIGSEDQAAENDLIVTVAEESMRQFLTLAPSLDP
jgi:hypothetical protein